MNTTRSNRHSAVKKVYFCGSMRGGREDAEIYEKILQCIRERALVLTEHVGDMTLDAGLTDREIYERDMELLQECDLVVAECTTPSLGVGYELAAAGSLGKPVLVLFCRDAARELSCMAGGNPRFSVVQYVKKDLDRILEGILVPMLS